ACRLLQYQVSVQHHRLQAGKKAVLFIEVSPSCLDQGRALVREMVDHLLEQLRLRKEVRIEDQQKLALRGWSRRFQGTRLEAGAIGAVAVFDVQALGAKLFHLFLARGARLVRRVIEDLDL